MTLFGSLRFRSLPLIVAAGTFLLCFFVHSVATARTKMENIEVFSANEAQNDDSAVETDLPKKDDSSDSTDIKENNDKKNRWGRLDRDARGVPTRLSTSIVRYEGRFRGNDDAVRDVSVDLIGAIHIAEPNYYADLNKTFQEYETVVFEMVVSRDVDVRAAIESERAQKPTISASPLSAISLMQQVLGDSLGLVYQIDGIDYTAENMRRGDAFTEDFLAKVLTNGDVPNFFLDAFVQAFFDRSLGKTEGWALACAVAKDKQTTMRRLIATELIDSEFEPDADADDAQNLTESERENALIHYRNKIALETVRAELAAGRTKIAVFFGAAHMPNLANRLETEFQLKQIAEPRWVTAWSMESER